jgi:hypothetical protein
MTEPAALCSTRLSKLICVPLKEKLPAFSNGTLIVVAAVPAFLLNEPSFMNADVGWSTPVASTTAPRQMIFYDRGGFGTRRVRDC